MSAGAIRRYAIIVVVILIIAALALVFRDRLSGQAGDLQVGDCFDLPDPTSETISDVQHHPCNEAHHYEVVFTFKDPSGSDATYPAVSAFDTEVGAQCAPAFATYVGIAFGTSALDMGYFYPQSSGWSNGDRTVTCYVSTRDGSALTSSVKGSQK